MYGYSPEVSIVPDVLPYKFADAKEKYKTVKLK